MFLIPQDLRRTLAMTAQRGELSAKQTITAKKIINEMNRQSVQVWLCPDL